MEHETERERKRNVIIATPKPDLGEGLKKHFEIEGINVLGVYVIIEHLIEDLHSFKNQPDFKLDGLVINSSMAKKGKDKRLEFLADVIEKIRDDFSETSIIFLSDETQGHPLLAELVSMGIYNIFAKSAQKSESLNVKQLIRCIDHPMLYNEVKKFREFDKDIPWRRFVNGGQSITINVNSAKESMQEKQDSKAVPKEKRIPTNNSDSQTITDESFPTTTVNSLESGKQKGTENLQLPDILEEDLEEEEFLWTLPPVKPKVIVRDRIIGKQIIAVAGIDRGVGTTHTAILIANYFASQGYQVKLIECSGNSEYVYIEKSYEGKNADLNRSDEFQINGVTFVKNDDEIDMASQLTSEHTHIVLDLGLYENSNYIEEFHRAGVQLLVGSGSEWKQHTLKKFITLNRADIQHRWKFLIPFVEKQTIDDIQGEIKEFSVRAIPYHPDPFMEQDNTGECFDELFEGRVTKKRKIIKISIAILGILVFAGVSMYFTL